VPGIIARIGTFCDAIDDRGTVTIRKAGSPHNGDESRQVDDHAHALIYDIVVQHPPGSRNRWRLGATRHVTTRFSIPSSQGPGRAKRRNLQLERADEMGSGSLVGEVIGRAGLSRAVHPAAEFFELGGRGRAM
jgi:hypothetical protein